MFQYFGKNATKQVPLNIQKLIDSGISPSLSSTTNSTSSFTTTSSTKPPSSNPSSNPSPKHSDASTAIQILVDRRTVARSKKDWATSDVLRQLLKTQHNVIVKDIPFKSGGGSTWRYQDEDRQPSTTTNYNILSTIKAMQLQNTPTTFDFNHIYNLIQQDLSRSIKQGRELQGRKCADVAFSLALLGYSNENVFELLLQGAMEEIERCRNRTSFRPYDMIVICEKFALAGVRFRNQFNFFSQVVEICREKIRKKETDLGKKSSSKHQYDETLSNIADVKYSLLSHRPLLSLWRYSARQKKCGKQNTDKDTDKDTDKETETEKKKVAVAVPLDVGSLFSDPTLPIIFDAGCGWGVTILGLASNDSSSSIAASFSSSSSKTASKTACSAPEYNYLGCDMSSNCVRYANGLSSRWGLSKHCMFVCASVDAVVHALKSYPGHLHLVMIQFPTPYRITEFQKMATQQNKKTEMIEDGSSNERASKKRKMNQDVKIVNGVSMNGGNMQLPCMIDFMITSHLLQEIEMLLLKKKRQRMSTSNDGNSGNSDNSSNSDNSGNTCFSGGGIYFQTMESCEDVAVTLNHMLMVNCTSLKPRKYVSSTSGTKVDVKMKMDTKVDRKVDMKVDRKVDVQQINKEVVVTRHEKYLQYVLSCNDKSWGRADGEMWWKESPFLNGATETEAMCCQENKRIHRMWWN